MMNAAPLSLVTTGFVLGWSVAWPPGPINAEIARRCLANGFWSGFGVLLGACAGDALWAILVALGVGTLFTGATTRLVMGVLSVGLLVALAVVFLKGAIDGWRMATRSPAVAPARFESRRGSLILGATMALTSPWNVAFWLAAIGRPEMTALGFGALLTVAAAVLAGALTWGLLWSASVVLLHRSLDRPTGRDWWGIGVKGLTGALMLWFAWGSTTALWGAG